MVARPDLNHDELLKKYKNLITAVKFMTNRPVVVGTILQFDTRLCWEPRSILRMQLKSMFLNKKLKKKIKPGPNLITNQIKANSAQSQNIPLSNSQIEAMAPS